MKTCTHCHRVLPLDAFGAHAGRADGKDNRCRECKTREQRARRATPQGRAEANAAARAYYRRKSSGIARERADAA